MIHIKDHQTIFVKTTFHCQGKGFGRERKSRAVFISAFIALELFNVGKPVTFYEVALSTLN